MTYSSQLHVPGDAVLPGKAEDMRQIEGEVYDAAAGSCQVGLVEEHTHQETLHDGGDSKSQQEKEDKDGVAVIQHLSALREKKDVLLVIILWASTSKHNCKQTQSQFNHWLSKTFFSISRAF